MERISVNGIGLEFNSTGSGDAVVFIHGVGVADTGMPLALEPALRDHYRIIWYRRRGYAGSGPTQGPISVADHAQDCLGLLSALDVRQAHVGGHSYGAFVVLQLALAAPELVSSLALFEPPMNIVVNPQRFYDEIAPVAAKHSVDDYFSVVLGPDWRAEISRTVPGGPEQAEKDAVAMFDSDLLPGQEWRFGAEEAAQITQPVFVLYGAETSPAAITLVRDLLHAWLPQTEDDVMPDANHLLHLRHPADAAARLANFLRRHPITASSS